MTDLATLPLFGGLTPEERGLIAEAAAEVSYTAGERLFSTDEPADACWILSSGLVELTTAVPGRGDVVIQTLGRGDLLGWSWLVPPYHWHFDATAVQPVSAVRLDAARLRALAERHPAFGYRLATAVVEVLSGRLQATRARLLDLYGNPGDRA
ncbi:MULTISPECIES: Crp/Fnr family transcriptional regulator [Amycolatopsis]|uniref:Cyclic nucleotide-binding domain-containing protein n=2 Tax=Amycolatopsis TaxID=1813 RepID=A0A1I3KV77_9PSEU|nr:cyclic nucleotide-binding domain-containing protein [Amycolatopsis sacchari]SFI76429.1 Cyclic nucleotide-binding domain-containing protein [Amycolatopsis sacchari]